MSVISRIRQHLREEADRARFLDKRIREIEAELQRFDAIPVDSRSSLEQVIDDVQARRAERGSYASHVLQFPEIRQEAPR